MPDILPIQTDSLILREFSRDDVPRVYQMSREQSMKEWLPDQVYPDEKHTAEVLGYLISQYSQLKSPELVAWVLGVVLKSTGELIGHVGLSPARDKAEIGFAIEERNQGKGYATQAVIAAVNWGHRVFGLDSILGIAAAANTGSCRVLEKAGFNLIEEKRGFLHSWRGLVRTYESLKASRLFRSDLEN